MNGRRLSTARSTIRTHGLMPDSTAGAAASEMEFVRPEAVPPDGPDPIRLGISACLLGREVRYDGTHSRDRFLTDELGKWVVWVPGCPEVAIGLGTPRPAIRLERRDGATRLVQRDGAEDLTDRMREHAEARIEALRNAGISGYVLKNRSPTCGMERVKVWEEGGMPSRDGVGVFARVLMERMPHLPVEEEGRLNDPALRENFVARLFAYWRWRELLAAGASRPRLFDYHRRHKFLLMSREPAAVQELGRLLGTADASVDPADLAERYMDRFTRAMKTTPTRKKHTNVLQHVAGYLSDELDGGDRRELSETIHDYRTGLVPLVVPITLLRHHLRRIGQSYLEEQVYLRPHPHELMLLNRV